MEEANSDEEDLDMQVHQLLEKSAQGCFRDYLDRPNGWRKLIRGSVNFYLEAVLISLVNIESYADFFIHKKYCSTQND